MVNIGLIQMSAEPLNAWVDLSKAEQYIADTAQDGADLTVLPEMFRLYQNLCFSGFEEKYEQLCCKYNNADLD